MSALGGFLEAPDVVLWEYAKANGFAIVTADADFYELAINDWAHLPKVIWLSGCDYPTPPPRAADSRASNPDCGVS